MKLEEPDWVHFEFDPRAVRAQGGHDTRRISRLYDSCISDHTFMCILLFYLL